MVYLDYQCYFSEVQQLYLLFPELHQLQIHQFLLVADQN